MHIYGRMPVRALTPTFGQQNSPKDLHKVDARGRQFLEDKPYRRGALPMSVMVTPALPSDYMDQFLQAGFKHDLMDKQSKKPMITGQTHIGKVMTKAALDRLHDLPFVQSIVLSLTDAPLFNE